jgi:hypothetical protein
MPTNPKKSTTKRKPLKSVKKPDAVKRSRAAKSRAGSALTYQPGISPGSVDVTGIVPEGVHVEPYITEGHSGYEESGTSELHPGR